MLCRASIDNPRISMTSHWAVARFRASVTMETSWSSLSSCRAQALRKWDRCTGKRPAHLGTGASSWIQRSRWTSKQILLEMGLVSSWHDPRKQLVNRRYRCGAAVGRYLDPRGAKLYCASVRWGLQVRAWSPGAYDSLHSLHEGEPFAVQALQTRSSSSDECCITRLTCHSHWQEMARASIHFLIRWFLWPKKACNAKVFNVQLCELRNTQHGFAQYLCLSCLFGLQWFTGN